MNRTLTTGNFIHLCTFCKVLNLDFTLLKKKTARNHNKCTNLTIRSPKLRFGLKPTEKLKKNHTNNTGRHFLVSIFIGTFDPHPAGCQLPAGCSSPRSGLSMKMQSSNHLALKILIVFCFLIESSCCYERKSSVLANSAQCAINVSKKFNRIIDNGIDLVIFSQLVVELSVFMQVQTTSGSRNNNYDSLYPTCGNQL